jgi:hypothetical protein
LYLKAYKSVRQIVQNRGCCSFQRVDHEIGLFPALAAQGTDVGVRDLAALVDQLGRSAPLGSVAN